MGYVDENLVPGETVAYRARLHWIVVAPALIVGAILDLTGVGLVVAAFLTREPGSSVSIPMILGAAILMLVGSAWMAAGIIGWKATEITVTSRRVLIKTGIVRRHTKEILLSKVESVTVDESMMARVLGFGTLTIHGTGGTPETFDRVGRPHEFRRQVQIQIEAMSGPGTARVR
ncbi:MAG TPA: PH domain-containing protein [Candidatus Eisenbacteria bacterium]